MILEVEQLKEKKEVSASFSASTGAVSVYVYECPNPHNGAFSYVQSPLGLDDFSIGGTLGGYYSGTYQNVPVAGVNSAGQPVGGGQLGGMVQTVAYGAAAEAVVMGGGYLAVQAWPAIAAGGAATYNAAQNAYYRAMAWQPMASTIDRMILYYPQSPPARASIGELASVYGPYAAQFGYGIAPGPGGPYANRLEAGSWFAGWVLSGGANETFGSWDYDSDCK